MKSCSRLWILLSLAMLTGAIPTISDGVLRIPLKRGSRTSGNIMPVHSDTGERFLSAQRANELVGYAYEKYKSTFAAYERNTGSRHPLDTLQRTSSPMNLFKRTNNGAEPLTNDGVELWYGSITVGTPPKTFRVDIDTGSADLWIFSAPCAECLGHRSYEPSQSTTCQRPPDVAYGVVYGSGAVFGTGFVDNVGVAGFNILRQAFLAVEFATPEFLPYFYLPDGLLGLGFQEISVSSSDTVMTNLNLSSRLAERVFCFKFSTKDGESAWTIGGEDRSAHKPETRVNIPVTERGYWQVVLEEMSLNGHQVSGTDDIAAIMDTGTTLIIAPCDVVEEYIADIPGAQCGPCVTSSTCTVPCATINDTKPTLKFGGRSFQVSNESWNLGPTDDSSTNCTIGLGQANFGFVIVGDVFLQNVYTIFDFANYSVGIAELAS